MIGKVMTTVAVVLLGGSVVAAGPLSGDGQADREKAFLEWAEAYQARARTICERVSAPSRVQAEGRLSAAMRELTSDHQRQLQTNMEALGEISDHGWPSYVRGQGWSPSVKRGVTRWQKAILREYRQCRRDHSPRRAASEALARGRSVQRCADEWCRTVVQDEARIARLERKYRTSLLKPIAREYAINWMLGGHPDTYLPAAWSRLARQSGEVRLCSVDAGAGGKEAREEIRGMRASIRELTDALVAVGLGDFGPDYVVQAERQVLERRYQAQTLMADLTGHRFSGNEVRLASSWQE